VKLYLFFVKSKLTNFGSRHGLLLFVIKFEPDWRICIVIVLEPIVVTLANFNLTICCAILLLSEVIFSFT
jgi:hypothetical protein